jgi:hypothetical protein
MRLALAALLVLVLAGCPKTTKALNAVGYWEYTVDAGVVLQWKVDGQSLNIIVSAPTEGWIGVGFDPTTQMLGANILIGYVDSAGAAQVSDEYGHATTAHQADTADGGTNDLTGISGTQTVGHTELRFTIPLDSGDPTHDKPLAVGGTHRFLLSYGATDDTTQRHTGGPFSFEQEL